MGSERTPVELRERVREGIVGALDRDGELRGGRTARLLVAAGALGIFGAVGMVLLVSGHPFGHHPAWHLVLSAAVWSGLLVVALAIMMLNVRTPTLPLAQAVGVGVVALGLAGLCGAICPDPHFLDWWSTTGPGERAAAVGGLGFSVLCFGFVTTLAFGIGATLLARGVGRGRLRPLLPASMMVLLLAPGVALQSIGTSWLVFAGWLLGTMLGAHLGVSIALAVRARFGIA